MRREKILSFLLTRWRISAVEGNSDRASTLVCDADRRRLTQTAKHCRTNWVSATEKSFLEPRWARRSLQSKPTNRLRPLAVVLGEFHSVTLPLSVFQLLLRISKKAPSRSIATLTRRFKTWRKFLENWLFNLLQRLSRSIPLGLRWRHLVSQEENVDFTLSPAPFKTFKLIYFNAISRLACASTTPGHRPHSSS